MMKPQEQKMCQMRYRRRAMTELLKKCNRTLLELWTGMTVFGLICETVLLIFSKNRGIHSASLWTGVIMGVLASVHMYFSLDRALDFPEGAAKKKITFSYVLRYTVVVIVFAVICVTKFFNPLLVFLGYMSLKVGALIQPQTHKVYNAIFHETDPEPMTEEEYNALMAAAKEDEKEDEKEKLQGSDI